MSSEFAEDLRKSFFPNLLNGKFGEDIRKDIKDFRENIEGLKEKPNYYKALERLVVLVMTNSWWRPLSAADYKKYKNQFSLYNEKFGDEGFKTKEGKKELLKIVNQFATANKNKAIQKTRELIEILTDRGITIRNWTRNLYDLAKNRKTEILGDKGRDNYLRDFGYFDRAPMDRHEWGFIIRTGIYHHHAKRKESDPQDRNHLQAALARFCNKLLERFEVRDINECLGQHLDLGKNAGMVDLFVWSHSSDERYHVCGKNPQCPQCNLKSFCMFRLLSTE